MPCLVNIRGRPAFFSEENQNFSTLGKEAVGRWWGRLGGEGRESVVGLMKLMMLNLTNNNRKHLG